MATRFVTFTVRVNRTIPRRRNRRRVLSISAEAIPFPRRLGHADEFASLAMHMIDNPYLNGEVVRLDAALRMAPR